MALPINLKLQIDIIKDSDRKVPTKYYYDDTRIGCNHWFFEFEDENDIILNMANLENCKYIKFDRLLEDYKKQSNHTYNFMCIDADGFAVYDDDFNRAYLDPKMLTKYRSELPMQITGSLPHNIFNIDNFYILPCKKKKSNV